jgi:hypothetical protein
MASRATQQKVAKQKAYRSKLLGRHPRFHGWTFEVTQEKIEIAGRAQRPMPETKIDTQPLVAEYLSRNHINKAACKGIMPHGSYGLALRKARGAPVKQWSGTDGRPNNAIAAPTGRGAIVNSWSTDQTWRIAKK